MYTTTLSCSYAKGQSNILYSMQQVMLEGLAEVMYLSGGPLTKLFFSHTFTSSMVVDECTFILYFCVKMFFSLVFFLLLSMCRWFGGRVLWWALIAFCKQPKLVDLMDKICDAGPPSKPEPHHQSPHHHKCIEYIHSCPAPKEKRRFLDSVLSCKGRSICHHVCHSWYDIHCECY